MTTKAEMVAILKAENPSLRAGDEERGYVDLTPAEYEAQIALWADNLLAKEADAAQDAADATAKAALLKRLGLTAAEAELLLG